MRAEGVSFRTGVRVGHDVSLATLLEATHDAVVLAWARPCRASSTCRARPRGVHLAMTFLTQQNRVVAGDTVADHIRAEGLRVVVLGGGDTGADCVGTSHRQGAASVTQIELMPRPPEGSDPANPWPRWPMILRTSTSHEEGGTREWALRTLRITGDARGRVQGIEAERVELFTDASGRRALRPASEERVEIACDLVLLAMGFTGPRHEPSPLLCGDARRGASLVVCGPSGRAARPRARSTATSWETPRSRRCRCVASSAEPPFITPPTGHR